MPEYHDAAGLKVHRTMYDFVRDEALPGSGVDHDVFWGGLAAAVRELVPSHREALARREELQLALDAFHRASPRPTPSAYVAKLRELGYLADPPPPFTVRTQDVDSEVSGLAGPQLVVPILNARFATNAANARWGSLYDAMYGTDVVPAQDSLARYSTYNPRRGAEVSRRVREFLDDWLPLVSGSHGDVDHYAVDDAGLVAFSADAEWRLADPGQFVGYRGERSSPAALVLTHHGLHVEIDVDRDHPVGADDRAGVRDVLLESALTTIMDLEDSVAAVDALDKVEGYRNWLLLMQGTLASEVTKDGVTFTRRMSEDRVYTTAGGGTVELPGRALLFIRQTGHLMTTDAVLDEAGSPVPEGIVDAFMTGLGSCHDLRGNTRLPNSRAGSMYVVKPKMHGPDEVALTVRILELVEQTVGFAPKTIKLGIMDEERRTSVNLAACIYAARDRIAFINTGFLDRTGDEIHTCMHAGPMVLKNTMRTQPWLSAYEQNNVAVGLACGMAGRAQIGKGMWPAPDDMADMLAEKIAHPMAGASTAWVPSPTAATLHAVHYHQVNVPARQAELSVSDPADCLSDLLTIPVGDTDHLDESVRLAELDNNVQSLLGYVVRWIDAGVGCSKVPDTSGRLLMEDRATCRISSQHVANWLLHGVITSEQVEASLRRMAILVDAQNASDPDYRPMSGSFDGYAFLAARELLLDGTEQPSGYTEPILHRHRREVKEQTREEGSVCPR